MKKYLVRLSVVGLWIGIVAAILYFPKWKESTFEENCLNVFAWGDILEPSVVSSFEKETGIKINLNYYSSNEELLVKLKATKGKGYDLIIPSDYAVNLLRKEGLLKKIDKDKLDFKDRLNPKLLGHHFDPQNDYSIPFEWEIFLLGINKDYFQNSTTPPSWKFIFDQKEISYRIAMVNDPREAIQLAAFYLYGDANSIEGAKLEEVKNLLIQQKSWVEAYASFRADYFLATKNCPVVVASSSYIFRTMKKYPFIGYLMPKEGTFITIENIALPVSSKKETQAYQFINYLFRPESVKKHHETFGFFPSTISNDSEPLYKEAEENFEKFHFISSLIPEQQINQIWVEVKSSNESYELGERR